MSDRDEQPPTRADATTATAVPRRFWSLAPLAAVFAAGAALAGLVVAEVTAPPTILPEPPAPPRPAAPSTSSQTAPIDDSAFAATLLTRPLFNPARRPALLGGDPAPVATAQAAPPRLAGTVITGRDNRVALLALPSAEKLLVVREGDTVGPFHITQIKAGEVVAESRGGPVTLHMGHGVGHWEAPPEPARDVASDNGHRATGAPDQDE